MIKCILFIIIYKHINPFITCVISYKLEECLKIDLTFMFPLLLIFILLRFKKYIGFLFYKRS